MQAQANADGRDEHPWYALRATATQNRMCRAEGQVDMAPHVIRCLLTYYFMTW